jgi:hypothetical protein
MLVGTAPLVPLIAIGMMLTTAGIYGVRAFAIARRSRELALRIAIGATVRDLIRLVTAQSAQLIVTGSRSGSASLSRCRASSEPAEVLAASTTPTGPCS